jgi:hypothetical protein
MPLWKSGINIKIFYKMKTTNSVRIVFLTIIYQEIQITYVQASVM